MNRLKKSAAAALVAGVTFVRVTQAATYYIDYTEGSDANNGSSQAEPWQRHPYMVGFSGQYTHAGGDRFIFKGGVTWPRSVFPMRIPLGGASADNRDYYGADKSWFTGTGFRF
jgi:hypothetical protein